ILITGWFESTVDFDPGSCTYNVTSTGDETFIMKLSLTSSGCIKPTITGFSPANGNVGTIVTINGTNFNTTPANNIVYFGATRAVVSASTSTQLTVSVPTGAIFEPITVTVNGKTGSSSEPFITTFADGGVINSCAFAPMVQYSSGNFGYGIATGDIDGDGKVDMVVSNGPTSVVQIYRNTSVTGTIDANSFATSVNLPVGLNTYGIDVADVDGDGKLDILAAGLADKIITIYRTISSPAHLPAASFAARVDLPTFSSIRPINVQAVDLDGDG
ncbi:MAG TPA: FG-GAP-like repeat-containing protein, partial [Chitinophagales bacterium]|nr:FG-GAP-like repeat-containing protein [Chitinophagales bacterium]